MLNKGKRNLSVQSLGIFKDEDEEFPEKESRFIYISEFDQKPKKIENYKNEIPKFGTDLHKDINSRPDMPTINEYEEVPVSSFGLSLLKDMGWKEGHALGKTNKGLSQPIEFIPRAQGLGLGIESTEKYIENIKTNPRGMHKNLSGPIVEKNGKVRHYKGINEKVTMKAGPQVVILRGKYRGQNATLLSADRHSKTGKVMFQNSEVEILPSDYYRFNSSESIVDYKSSYAAKKSSVSLSHGLNVRTKGWLFPNLHVRIISHSFENGKYFNKKARIIDIKSSGTCTCLVDNEDIFLKNVEESFLETIVPRLENAKVMIVGGKYKSESAKILTRDSKNYTATVELQSSKDVKKLSYNNICEILAT